MRKGDDDLKRIQDISKSSGIRFWNTIGIKTKMKQIEVQCIIRKGSFDERKLDARGSQPCSRL